MAKIVPYEPESKQSVLQEYEILKALHHDKIMTLHEAYVTPRYLVLISECCTGKELLHSLIDRSETIWRPGVHGLILFICLFIDTALYCITQVNWQLCFNLTQS